MPQNPLKTTDLNRAQHLNTQKETDLGKKEREAT